MIDQPDELQPFYYNGERPFEIASAPTSIGKMQDNRRDYEERLQALGEQIDERQQVMYAHDRHAMLLIFQAIDAAGKDGTIRAVMSGINPHGVEVHAFKQPSSRELDHDFLWRTNKFFPPRGRIGIFNRSYYEEVLIVRVHSEIIDNVQRIPHELTADRELMWRRRYEDIRNLERYHYHNGTRIVKFFLHLSKDEQARRFLSRIERPSKNWKFAGSDVRERARWDEYQHLFEEAVNQTAAPHAPWYAIPADNKRTMRLLVAKAVLAQLRDLDMDYPQMSDDRLEKLDGYRRQLLKELENGD